MHLVKIFELALNCFYTKKVVEKQVSQSTELLYSPAACKLSNCKHLLQWEGLSLNNQSLAARRTLHVCPWMLSPSQQFCSWLALRFWVFMCTAKLLLEAYSTDTYIFQGIYHILSRPEKYCKKVDLFHSRSCRTCRSGTLSNCAPRGQSIERRFTRPWLLTLYSRSHFHTLTVRSDLRIQNGSTPPRYDLPLFVQ